MLLIDRSFVLNSIVPSRLVGKLRDLRLNTRLLVDPGLPVRHTAGGEGGQLNIVDPHSSRGRPPGLCAGPAADLLLNSLLMDLTSL